MFLRLATRTSPKIVATALGIALCVMFLSGSLALLDGMRDATANAAARFDEGPLLAYASLPLEDARVDPTVLASLTGPYAAVRVARATASVGGVPIGAATLASVSNGSILRTSLAGLADGDVWLSDALLADARAANATFARGDVLAFTANATVDATYDRVRPRTALPDGWSLVSEATMRALAPPLADPATFLLLPEGSPDVPGLRAAGFTVVPAVAAVEFFRQGIDALAPALLVLVLAAGAVIALLAFTLLALETRYRARELRTMRRIGAPPSFVTRLILAQSAFVALFGALLGLALASVVTNGVTSFAPLAGLPSFVLPQPTATGLLLPVLVALAAGLLGGAVPARSAAKLPTEGSPRS